MNLNQFIMFAVRLLAGTGVFLVGVHLLTSNIEQLATEKIKNIFGKTADKKLTNVAIGTAATALIQSSGVTTVLIVAFDSNGSNCGTECISRYYLCSGKRIYRHFDKYAVQKRKN